MNDKNIRASITLGVETWIAETRVSSETKEKIGTIVNMTAASAKIISKEANVEHDVFINLIANRLMSKARGMYMERSDKSVDT